MYFAQISGALKLETSTWGQGELCSLFLAKALLLCCADYPVFEVLRWRKRLAYKPLVLAQTSVVHRETTLESIVSNGPNGYPVLKGCASLLQYETSEWRVQGPGGNTHQLERSIPLETRSYVFIPIFSRSLQF